MKTLTRSLFLAATSLFSACSDKNEEPAPTPDPKPIYRVGHAFYYPATNSTAAAVHPSQDVAATAKLSSQVLALDFTAGPDAPHFEITRTQLREGWVGTYTLQTPSRPSLPVFASYSYAGPGGGYRIFRFSNFSPNLTGDVTITAYDAKRQLVSGHFEVNAPGEANPVTDNSTEKCDITLFGEFTDMKVQTVQ